MGNFTLNFMDHKKESISRKNFRGMLNQSNRWVQHAQNFVKKPFVGGSKTEICESFLLYGITFWLIAVADCDITMIEVPVV